jgi:dTDP-4-dehydrorhamnose 3,5-epimerase-like enzyme
MLYLQGMLKNIQLISFDQQSDPSFGSAFFIHSQHKVPFEIRRIYWTYQTPPEVIRGHHAHKRLEQVLVAVNGKICVYTEFPDGRKQTTTLHHPNMGLFIPTHCWHTLGFSADAVLMVMASQEFDADEYVRDYNVFLKAAF